MKQIWADFRGASIPPGGYFIWRAEGRRWAVALAADRAVTATDLLWPRGSAGYFWTNSGTADRPVYAMLKTQISILADQNYKGFSIRCVKD